MRHLVPCSGCARHVRASESSCPFCGAALAVAIASPRGPTPRMGRAARFAFGAAVATTLTVTGCGESHEGDPDAGAPMDAGHDAGLTSEPAAPPDSGHDAGLTSEPGEPPDAGDHDAGMDGGSDMDAGEEDAGGIVPPYGAPPAD